MKKLLMVGRKRVKKFVKREFSVRIEENGAKESAEI